MRRFLLPNLNNPILVGGEAHHAVHVLRIKAGEAVSVFDGRGLEAKARVVEVNKDSVRLIILKQSRTSPLSCRITLAQAIPKKNMDLIVQKATELGVSVIVPLLTERTVVHLDQDSKKLERWREIALDACKQCGNNWLPEIQRPQPIHDFVNAPGQFDLKLIASLQSDANPLKQILSSAQTLKSSSSHSVVLMVGPEGDFTPAELELAKTAGFVPLSLGPLVLRADTAALYALSILHHELISG